jgi:hypothetical protein
MDLREQLAAFWAGERPDQIPYTIYQSKLPPVDHPVVQQMFADGLGVTCFVPTWEVSYDASIDIRDDFTRQDGRQLHRQTWRTPVGEIFATWTEDWHQKYFLATAEDYRVMMYIVEHTTLAAAYESFLEQDAALPPYAVAVPRMGRTPLQTILVDYAGLGNFALHLYEYEEEVRALYEALLVQFRRHIEIVAGGPGRYINVLENFTAETLGPRRYREFLLPVYEECFPLLQGAGKVVGCHYDGQLAVVKDLIAGAPIDLIESLTPPPEGDLSLVDARAAWPDKLFWAHINLGCYDLPAEELRRLVLGRIEEGAPDGRRLAFEVSEQLPARWLESMPVVLDALAEARTCFA